MDEGTIFPFFLNSITCPQPTALMRKNYFFIASILLLLLSVIAFSDNLFFDTGQQSNSDPKFIIHGLFMFAWFIILVIQTGYIRNGNHKAHMRLGLAGMITAIGVFLSTVYVFVMVFKGWDAMAYFVKANRFFMLSFAVLLILAYRNRKTAAKHKRFVYLASLLILEPILSRVSGNLGLSNPEAFIAITWNSFFISWFVYDWLTLKKIHPITWMGFVWFYIVWGISIML